MATTAFTSIIASLALFISFLQETAKAPANSTPMRPEFIAAATCPMQFKACADLQRAFSPEAQDAASITTEILKLFAKAEAEDDFIKGAAIIDSLILKGPQYAVFGIDVSENGDDDVIPYAAIQFKEAIPPEIVTAMNQWAVNTFNIICLGDHVLATKTLQKAPENTQPQTAILPEGAFLRVTADLAKLENPAEALNDILDTPFPEFASVRFASITCADAMTIEARFADAAGAQAAAKIASKSKKFLLKEFANYPIFNAEITKINVTQNPVSDADGRGSFRVLAVAPYDALTALATAASKKEEDFSKAVLGKRDSAHGRPKNSKAARLGCVNNLKQIVLALHMYMADNNDVLPAADNWQQLLKDYIDAKVTKCPATEKPYIYALNGQQLKDFKQPSKTIAFYEDLDSHRDSVNIAFVDGHVETVKLDGANTIEELAEAKGFILLK